MRHISPRVCSADLALRRLLETELRAEALQTWLKPFLSEDGLRGKQSMLGPLQKGGLETQAASSLEMQMGQDYTCDKARWNEKDCARKADCRGLQDGSEDKKIAEHVWRP